MVAKQSQRKSARLQSRSSESVQEPATPRVKPVPLPKAKAKAKSVKPILSTVRSSDSATLALMQEQMKIQLAKMDELTARINAKNDLESVVSESDEASDDVSSVGDVGDVNVQKPKGNGGRQADDGDAKEGSAKAAFTAAAARPKLVALEFPSDVSATYFIFQREFSQWRSTYVQIPESELVQSLLGTMPNELKVTLFSRDTNVRMSDIVTLLEEKYKPDSYLHLQSVLAKFQAFKRGGLGLREFLSQRDTLRISLLALDSNAESNASSGLNLLRACELGSALQTQVLGELLQNAVDGSPSYEDVLRRLQVIARIQLLNTEESSSNKKNVFFGGSSVAEKTGKKKKVSKKFLKKKEKTNANSVKNLLSVLESKVADLQKSSQSHGDKLASKGKGKGGGKGKGRAGKTDVCHNCGRTGHWARDCRSGKREQPAEGSSDSADRKNILCKFGSNCKYKDSTCKFKH